MKYMKFVSFFALKLFSITLIGSALSASSFASEAPPQEWPKEDPNRTSRSFNFEDPAQTQGRVPCPDCEHAQSQPFTSQAGALTNLNSHELDWGGIFGRPNPSAGEK